ncbi:sodium/hydrogen exchanger [Polychaeton citri CBS 116435]|uniref:Sodium/hydrogen exchanger n=1 Tax=Polychaeton citri CBS 116435 TaxID=1314669 RepID=A0A9P4Q5C7_9PEZI|nr:sodium/hydrogen exchanger [Polychaeton citri CBS 116435]
MSATLWLRRMFSPSAIAAQVVFYTTFALAQTEDAGDDPDDDGDAGNQEILDSWSLLILILLLIFALFTSYVLQSRKIQAVHETVVSIFSGMIIGLILRLTAANSVVHAVTFKPGYFFNLLLPPIILASGYELHQANFFRNIGTILTFAFAGTFISALVLAIIAWAWTRIPLEGLSSLTFVDAMSMGATLSATDPVTILAIFNAYKVDPKLYTVIFGESILNDAIAIVLFTTAQGLKGADEQGSLTVLSLFESIGKFMGVFFGSMILGIIIGLGTSLLLKFTHIRREPKIESCIVMLIAYASYFFSNAITMSGIVSLLFCGICMKHYAYHNMSRRTQLTTKFIFSSLAQLSENFIFIYLGLALFTDAELEYKPLFILVTVLGICVARWCAVFPLAAIINAVIRYRAKRYAARNGMSTVAAAEEADELPRNHQIMLFWAGLRGAVGVALVAGILGPHKRALRATVLVVTVLTVIIFGGTTARMLEILNIRVGVVEEIDSDDEFDIERVPTANGIAFQRKNSSAFGHMPKASNGNIGLGSVNGRPGIGSRGSSLATGNAQGSPNMTPDFGRRNSSRARGDSQNIAEQGLLSGGSSSLDDDEDEDASNDLDLPPVARRSPMSLSAANIATGASDESPYPISGTRDGEIAAAQQYGLLHGVTARGAISSILNARHEDPGTLFSRLDENFLKPHLLLDPKSGGSKHAGSSGHHGGGSNEE